MNTPLQKSDTTPALASMRAFVLAFLLFKLFSCAEVSSKQSQAQPIIFRCLSSMPPDIVHKIGSYLDNPYSNIFQANHHFMKVFSTFPLKSIIYERFDIPELATNDVDNYEPELRYLLRYSQFARYYFIYSALTNEVYNGARFTTLIPNLMAYFSRMDRIYRVTDRYYRLFEHKKFGYFFKGDASLFFENFYIMFQDYSYVRDLHEYLVSNPENWQHVRKYFVEIAGKDSENYHEILRWIAVDFASSAPNMLLFDYPDIILDIFEQNNITLFTEIYVPKSLHSELFQKINDIVSKCSDERRKKYYQLLNLIRFGTEQENIKIECWLFSAKELFNLCRCASLSNKTYLFDELYPLLKSYIEEHPYQLDQGMYDREYVPLEMRKFIFDVHEKSDKEFQQLLSGCTEFIEIMSHYYRLVSMKSAGKDIQLVFENLSEAAEARVPDRVTVECHFVHTQNFLDFVLGIPRKMKLDNAAVFAEVVAAIHRHNRDHNCLINGENLKLILTNPDIIESIRQFISVNSITRALFYITTEEVVKVLDGPVCYLGDIVRVEDAHRVVNRLRHLESAEQIKHLENLETLTGRLVSKLINPTCDYFEYRLLFKYIKEKKQALPAGLSLTKKTLIELDFPSKAEVE